MFNRRQLLKGGGAAALMMGTGISPLAAATQAATPIRGGHVKLGVSGGHTGDSFDPIKFNDLYMTVVGAGAVYSRLVEVDTDGSLIGALAENWDVSSDARVWTFNLRKEVEFHNGQPFVAKDVIASLNYHRGDDSQSPVKQIVDQIADITEVTPHQVQVTLHSGNADFAFQMFDYHLVIMPHDKIAQGIGTGGYIVEDFDPGVRTVLRRNPNYFRGDSRAHFETVEVIHIADPTARTSAILSGTVDYISAANLSTLSTISRAPHLRINEQPSTKHYMFQMDCTNAQFSDPDVRMALKLGINREEVLNKLLYGHGQLGNDHPISAANRYLATDIPQRQYDPEQAKFHLKKAGLDGISVQLATSDGAFEGAVDMATLYRESAAKAGINVDIDRVPADGYWSNIWRKRPFCASYSSGRATEDWMLSSSYLSTAPWNATNWHNEQADKLIIEARTELDNTRRAELYGEVQRLISDTGGIIAPVFANSVEIYNQKLSHGQVGTANEMDDCMMIERWWLGEGHS